MRMQYLVSGPPGGAVVVSGPSLIVSMGPESGWAASGEAATIMPKARANAIRAMSFLLEW
jgi:hypothetical protein